MDEQNPFPSAAPDFSDPLGLLSACHQRILSHCRTLERLHLHLGERGLDPEAREAIGRIHRYFSTSGQHHHDDEERDLFPLLAGRSNDLDQLLARLLAEHGAMTALWQRLQPLLAAPELLLAERGRERLFADFVAAYRNHIDVEERNLLPLAERILSDQELEATGSAMAERRKVNR